MFNIQNGFRSVTLNHFTSNPTNLKWTCFFIYTAKKLKTKISAFYVIFFNHEVTVKQEKRR